MNAYRNASRAYGSVHCRTVAGKGAEAEAFARAAALLADARARGHDRTALGHALCFNQKLWTIMQAEALDPAHPAPQDMKQDMLSLAAFMDDATLKALAAERPRLDAMIQVNESLARGMFAGR